jgi:hypothetical protein
MNEEIENIEQEEVPATEESNDSGISFSVESNANSTEEEQVIEQAPVEEQEEIIEEAPENEVAEEDEDDEYVSVELTEDIAWRMLKDKKGLSQENFEELLTPKEQKKYAPEMEKFNEFIEKTGNKSFNDYLETQKDWSAETEDSQLRNYLKLSNPELTDKQVNRLYDKNYNTEGLDEEDDEDEILDRQIATKNDLKKATEFFNKRKEEFNAVGGSDEYIPIEYRDAKQLLEDQIKQEEAFTVTRDSRRNDFTSKTESLLNDNFKGFEVSYGNEKDGFIDVLVKPENIKEVRDFQMEQNNLNKLFFDEETGTLKDPQGYHKAMYMARNYQSELNKARMAGRAEQLDINDKLSKNIQPDNMRTVSNNVSAGITFSKE